MAITFFPLILLITGYNLFLLYKFLKNRSWLYILTFLGALCLLVLISPVLMFGVVAGYFKLTENERFARRLPPAIEITRMISKEAHGMCGTVAFEMTQASTREIKDKGLKFFEEKGYEEWLESRQDPFEAPGFTHPCASQFLDRYQIYSALKKPGNYYRDRHDNVTWVFPDEAMIVYTYFD
jgi:hypothetical protein